MDESDTNSQEGSPCEDDDEDDDFDIRKANRGLKSFKNWF